MFALSVCTLPPVSWCKVTIPALFLQKDRVNKLPAFRVWGLGFRAELPQLHPEFLQIACSGLSDVYMWSALEHPVLRTWLAKDSKGEPVKP